MSACCLLCPENTLCSLFFLNAPDSPKTQLLIPPLPPTPHIIRYGNTADYAAMIKDVVRRFPKTKIVSVGFSMGGNLITKVFCQSSLRSSANLPPSTSASPESSLQTWWPGCPCARGTTQRELWRSAGGLLLALLQLLLLLLLLLLLVILLLLLLLLVLLLLLILILLLLLLLLPSCCWSGKVAGVCISTR